MIERNKRRPLKINLKNRSKNSKIYLPKKLNKIRRLKSKRKLSKQRKPSKRDKKESLKRLLKSSREKNKDLPLLKRLNKNKLRRNNSKTLVQITQIIVPLPKSLWLKKNKIKKRNKILQITQIICKLRPKIQKHNNHNRPKNKNKLLLILRPTNWRKRWRLRKLISRNSRSKLRLSPRKLRLKELWWTNLRNLMLQRPVLRN